MYSKPDGYRIHLMEQLKYPHPADILPNTSFISVCIPTFCRPFYLEKLLDTLAEYADMPYEVVVHDDGSRPEFREEVFRLSHRISTLAFNNGLNLGLGESANRAIALASSKFILFMNDDCFFVRPCLRDICNALSKPYIGVISAANDVGPVSDIDSCVVSGTRFCLSNYLGGGSTIGFRKEVWAQVGGFDYRSTSGQADNVFIYKILKAGYWKALIEGPERIKVGNFVYPSPGSGLPDEYKPTQGFLNGNDCSIPKVFGIAYEDYVVMNHLRREACQWWVDGERTIPGRPEYDGRENPEGGLNDIDYWGRHWLSMFGGENSNSASKICWDVAEKYGQGRWHEMIAQDFRLANAS